MTNYLLLSASLVFFVVAYCRLTPSEASMVSIAAAFVLYVGIGISNLRNGNYPMAMVWWAYGLAQIGFGWLELNQWRMKK